MRWLWALGGILAGLILSAGLCVVLFRYVWMEAGCFRWDPGSQWRPPLHCTTLSGLLQFTTFAAFTASVFVPLLIAARRKR